MSFPSDPLPLSANARMRSARFNSASMFSSVLWLARTTWLKSGCTCVGSVSPSCAGGPTAWRALDIEVGFAEHARGVERGHRIAAQGVTVFRADLHRDFDGGKLLVFVGHDADVGHVADVHAAQTHRGAFAQSLRIIEIGFQSDARREESGGSGHQEQQEAQRQSGNDHRDPNAQLRPLELLLARQIDFLMMPVWM